MHRHLAHPPASTGSFEGHAASYDRTAWRLRAAYRRFARDVAATAQPGAAVVDLGAGSGHLLLAVARRRPDLALVGVDLAPDMVAAAGQRLGQRATVLTGDVAHLPLPDASADLVLSSLSAHHWADVEAAGREIARVLRPGGQLRCYDLHSGPLEVLAQVVGSGAPARVEPFRGGLLHLRRLHRLVVDVPPAP